MIVGQNECRRAALERPLEQHPIGNAVRMLGAAPDQLVAQECASPIEMDEEKVLVMSNIINADLDTLHVGMPVQVTWVEASEEWTVFMFEPVAGVAA